MKKSIKIIIVTLILLFTFSVTVSAAVDKTTIGKIKNMTDKELQALSTTELENYNKTLSSALADQTITTSERQEYAQIQAKVTNAINVKKGTADPAYGDIAYGEVDYRKYNPSTDLSGNTTVTNMAANIIVLIRSIGIAVAFISLLLIGIKYMIGSANEKAEYKKTLVPFAVGVIILGLGTSLVTVIYDIIKGIL